jgi:hypothetical protein
VTLWLSSVAVWLLLLYLTMKQQLQQNSNIGQGNKRTPHGAEWPRMPRRQTPAIADPSAENWKRYCDSRLKQFAAGR